MRRRLCAIVTAALALIGSIGPLHAQDRARSERVRISINGGVQPSAVSFATSITNPVYLEDSSIDTTYAIGTGRSLDGGAALRIAGRFGVGVAVSWFSNESDAAVSAAIPHPFLFSARRVINGTARRLERTEIAAHLQAVYTVQATRRIDIALTAGPSFFRVKQAFVDDVAYGDVYPFEIPTFTAALSTTVSSHKSGFNVGADLGMRLSPKVGVGALVRFARAQMTFALPNRATSVRSSAGGVQLAGGLRFHF